MEFTSNAKAEKLVSLADAKLTKTCFNLNKIQNYEDAAQNYFSAGTQFKVLKNLIKASECFEKAGNCFMNADNEIDGKSAFNEAGKCYQSINYNKAINMYKMVIEINLNANKFDRSAKLEEKIGDILMENHCFKKSIEAYKKSIEYYDVDTNNNKYTKNKILQKIIDNYIKLKQWKDGIQELDKMIKLSINTDILKYTIKGCCFKVMLLHILSKCDVDLKEKNVQWNDVLFINQKYRDISYLYESSQECKVIVSIIKSLPYNIKQFENNKNMTLFSNTWSKKLLSLIENYIQKKLVEEPDLRGKYECKEDDYQCNDPFNVKDFSGAPDPNDL